ncbi:acyl-CoA dehydrogenase family protein [Nocardia sp. NPDC059180]|uniref:acyl-CoA dehydrogenase family protein n=1 Tax=Nocardia sp. NPDC059180 TaxID=3346761 RepID=UPI0036BE70C2
MTLTTDIHASAGTDLIARVDEIGDLITSSQPEALRLRRATDTVAEALESNGLTRMSWPRSRGGAQLSMLEQHRVLTALAGRDGSTAWITAIWTATPHMIRLFGNDVFNEFLASDNTRAAGVFSITGTATKTAGGYTVTGAWPFVSGQHHSGWVVAPAHSDHDDQPLALLVPRSAFDLAGTWDMTGLVGTGSHPLRLDNAFVPDHHAITFQNVLDATGRDARIDDDPYYGQPLVPIICALSAGPAIGIATAASRYFSNLIHHRAIAYSPHQIQAHAPNTAYQVAEIQALIDTADYFGTRLACAVDHHIATGEPWTIVERVRSRFDAARAVRLCRTACDIIDTASGATAHTRHSPLTILLRDMQALSVHAFLAYDSAAEQYGRVLAGLEPTYPIY